MPEPTPQQRLPERVKARRKALGLSQDEAARRVGVTPRTWQRWEAPPGKGTSGALAHLPAMAQALETTPEELLGVGAESGAVPRSVGDMALDARLAAIETQQAVIRELLESVQAALADPRAVLREADALLESERDDPESR